MNDTGVCYGIFCGLRPLAFDKYVIYTDSELHLLPDTMPEDEMVVEYEKYVSTHTERHNFDTVEVATQFLHARCKELTHDRTTHNSNIYKCPYDEMCPAFAEIFYDKPQVRVSFGHAAHHIHKGSARFNFMNFAKLRLFCDLYWNYENNCIWNAQNMLYCFKMWYGPKSALHWLNMYDIRAMAKELGRPQCRFFKLSGAKHTGIDRNLYRLPIFSSGDSTRGGPSKSLLVKALALNSLGPLAEEVQNSDVDDDGPPTPPNERESSESSESDDGGPPTPPNEETADITEGDMSNLYNPNFPPDLTGLLANNVDNPVTGEQPRPDASALFAHVHNTMEKNRGKANRETISEKLGRNIAYNIDIGSRVIKMFDWYQKVHILRRVQRDDYDETLYKGAIPEELDPLNELPDYTLTGSFCEDTVSIFGVNTIMSMEDKRVNKWFEQWKRRPEDLIVLTQFMAGLSINQFQPDDFTFFNEMLDNVGRFQPSPLLEMQHQLDERRNATECNTFYVEYLNAALKNQRIWPTPLPTYGLELSELKQLTGSELESRAMEYRWREEELERVLFQGRNSMSIMEEVPIPKPVVETAQLSKNQKKNQKKKNKKKNSSK